MVEFTIGDIINVSSNVNAGEGKTISVYKWKWNNTEFGENISDINIDTSDMTVGNYNLSLEVQNSCNNWSVPYSEGITLVAALDPCEKVVCNNICIDYNLYSQKCMDGECVPVQLLEENSLSCGYIAPEIELPIDEPSIDEEEPFDMTKIYGLLAGIGLGAVLLFKK